MATYFVSPVTTNQHFERIIENTPEFIKAEFYDLAKGSDFWFKHVEGIDSEEALNILMSLINDNLSEKKIAQLLSDVEQVQLYDEVNHHFETAETEGEAWQGFETYLKRNEGQWAHDEKMAMYYNEY